jgi:SAM-dependent methyltransferase
MEQAFDATRAISSDALRGLGGADLRRLEVDLVATAGLPRDKDVGLDLTHPDITDLMVRLALSDGFAPSSVLDPAAGFGNFLGEVAHQAPGASDFIGYEPNPDAARIARARLARSAAIGANVEIREEDALAALIPPSSFDLVVCNPPYVRIQRLGEMRARLKAAYATAHGRFDLYFLFYELAARALRPGGRMSFITSNKFMTTNAGRRLRELLGAAFAPIRIIDFRDASPFRASVLSSIVVLEKGRNYIPGTAMALELSRTTRSEPMEHVTRLALDPPPELVEVPRLGASPLRAVIHQQSIQNWDASGKTWHLGAGSDIDLFAALADGRPRLDEFFPRLSVGIKTTADDVFVEPFHSNADCGVEPELLHPLIRGGSVRRWATAWDANNGYDRRVLYPHQRTPAGRTAPIDLDAFPGAKAYLESHRARLEGRRYVLEAGRQWFEIWVTQQIDLLSAPRKLVFPDFAVRNTFALDSTGAYVGSSAGFAVPHPSLSDTDLWYVAFLLNSPLYEFIHQRFLGTSILSKRHRYWIRHVAAYPLPWPDSAKRAELAAMGRDAAEGKEPEDHLGTALDVFSLDAPTKNRIYQAAWGWVNSWSSP